MPCTLTGSIEGDNALISKTTVTWLTQMLCGACKLLEDHGVDMSSVATGYIANGDLVPSGKNLSQWWEDHKRLDAERAKPPCKHVYRVVGEPYYINNGDDEVILTRCGRCGDEVERENRV